MTASQSLLWGGNTSDIVYEEDLLYLKDQLITYIGNKRALLSTIDNAVRMVQERLGRNKLSFVDMFAGSGVVSRAFKRNASTLWANDLEEYSVVSLRCYLANRDDIDSDSLEQSWQLVRSEADSESVQDGIIRRLYAPKADDDVQPQDRCFYTVNNAIRIDSARCAIEKLPRDHKNFLLGPLLSEASIKTNTSGVFKGFYKDKETGIGQFGGTGRNALARILSRIEINRPVLSRFQCETVVTQLDANALARDIPPHDIAYIDPPYNQHPYGSNYFMLNLISRYEEPSQVSRVSGIPVDWNRSEYNFPDRALSALQQLVEDIPAKYLLISYSSEGFISLAQMEALLASVGSFDVVKTQYNTFRGCRNLKDRPKHLTEFLFIVEKN